MLVDIMGYYSQRDVMFLKITLLLPKLLPSAKRVLEQGFGIPGHELRSYQCYETNIDFDTRYLLERNLQSCRLLPRIIVEYNLCPLKMLRVLIIVIYENKVCTVCNIFFAYLVMCC